MLTPIQVSQIGPSFPRPTRDRLNIPQLASAIKYFTYFLHEADHFFCTLMLSGIENTFNSDHMFSFWIQPSLFQPLTYLKKVVSEAWILLRFCILTTQISDACLYKTSYAFSSTSSPQRSLCDKDSTQPETVQVSYPPPALNQTDRQCFMLSRFITIHILHSPPYHSTGYYFC